MDTTQHTRTPSTTGTPSPCRSLTVEKSCNTATSDKILTSYHDLENDVDPCTQYVPLPDDLERMARPRTARFHVARRILKYVIALTFLAWLSYAYFFAPYRDEHDVIDDAVATGPEGSFFAHQPIDLSALTLVGDLPSKHLPGPRHGGKTGRIVVVGDVHGMLKSLEALLAKLDFDHHLDHLVLAGDMVSKGPDSVGVVQLAMKLGASAVRGNHEDRVLLARRSGSSHDLGLTAPSTTQLGSMNDLSVDSGAKIEDSARVEALSQDVTFSQQGAYKDRVLAAKFSDAEIRWLDSLPVILRLGHLKSIGDVLVVHAGLVPGVKLHRQDAYMAMNMRSINLDTWVPSNLRAERQNELEKERETDARDASDMSTTTSSVGESSDGVRLESWTRKGKKHKKGKRWVDWFMLWNRYQKKLAVDGEAPTTVVYGHDSKRGLQITRYSRGIDTGCLKGGQLTAVVLEASKHGQVEESLVHVDCRDGRGDR